MEEGEEKKLGGKEGRGDGLLDGRRTEEKEWGWKEGRRGGIIECAGVTRSERRASPGGVGALVGLKTRGEIAKGQLEGEQCAKFDKARRLGG